MAFLPTINELTKDMQGGGQIANVFNSLTNQALNQRKQQLENQYYGPNIESEMANRNALTTGYNINNQFAPDRLRLANEAARQLNDFNNQINPYKITEEQIKAKYAEEAQKAEINWKNTGGGRGSTGSKDENLYRQSVKYYNPNLNDQQLMEANDVYAQGGKQLSDGTQLAPMNPTIQRAYDRAFKSTTTAPLITRGVSANAAEAEMPIIDRYINEGRRPYGDTIPGQISPQQIKDSLDINNKAAQNRLGDYIAADLLTFDKAALQTRIAGTESGVTIINEVMQKSKQSINAKYPRLSNAARERALKRISSALHEMMVVRNKYGIGASSAIGKGNSGSSSVKDPLGIR